MMILALLKVDTRIMYGSMLHEKIRVSAFFAMLYGGVCVDAPTHTLGSTVHYCGSPSFDDASRLTRSGVGIFLPPSVSSTERSYLEGGAECFVQQLQRVSILVSCALLVPIAGDMRHHALPRAPPRPLPLQHIDQRHRRDVSLIYWNSTVHVISMHVWRLCLHEHIHSLFLLLADIMGSKKNSPNSWHILCPGPANLGGRDPGT